MPRSKAIPAPRLFIPSGDGYRRFEELTEDEQAAFRAQCVQRMGAALQDHFCANPDSYERTMRAVGVM